VFVSLSICVYLLIYSYRIILLLTLFSYLPTGVAIVGFAEAFLQLCNHTVGSLDGVCLDLNFFGISKIACGCEFIDSNVRLCQSKCYIILTFHSFLNSWLSKFLQRVGQKGNQNGSVGALPVCCLWPFFFPRYSASLKLTFPSSHFLSFCLTSRRAFLSFCRTSI